MNDNQARSQQSQTGSSPTLTLEAAKHAKVLLGCYRTGDANDPEVYVRAVVAVLAEYPLEVIAKVCDPRMGLPAKSKWLPTIYEIKDACESAMIPIDRRRREQQQIEDRKKLIAGPKVPRPTLAEIKAKHGENYGLKSDPETDAVFATKRTTQLLRANDALLQREYQSAKTEPIVSAGIPISPSLIKKLGGKIPKAKRA
jgi:hypothetical protein